MEKTGVMSINYGKEEVMNKYKFLNTAYLSQLFADDAGSTGTDNQNKTGQQDGTDDKQEGEKTPPADEKKYSDADVNKIVDRKFAEWQKKQDAKVSEAEKLAKMNEQQKAEFQRDQLQKQLDELTRKNTIAEMSKTARQMLTAEGVNISDALIEMIVSDDADTTKTNVTQFTTLFKTAVQDAVKDALKHKAPNGGSNGGSGITKEQIMAVQNRTERQKLIAEHMDMFKPE